MLLSKSEYRNCYCTSKILYNVCTEPIHLISSQSSVSSLFNLALVLMNSMGRCIQPHWELSETGQLGDGADALTSYTGAEVLACKQPAHYTSAVMLLWQTVLLCQQKSNTKVDVFTAQKISSVLLYHCIIINSFSRSAGLVMDWEFRCNFRRRI